MDAAAVEKRKFFQVVSVIMVVVVENFISLWQIVETLLLMMICTSFFFSFLYFGVSQHIFYSVDLLSVDYTRRGDEKVAATAKGGSNWIGKDFSVKSLRVKKDGKEKYPYGIFVARFSTLLGRSFRKNWHGYHFFAS